MTTTLPFPSATEVVDQLSKLVVESYVETDEDIGPRVAQFDKAHSQLKLIGEQLTSMRDATSATHEAHMQLVTLMEGGESSIPSIQAFGERQESLASLTQKLAAQYDRFVNLSVNQLEGLALVVSNKYKGYTAKVTETRKRKEQLQLLVRQKERSDLRSLERSLIPTSPGGSEFHTDLEGKLVRLSTTTGLWWSCYARIDVRRQVLLFTTRQSEPPSAASKAVALKKYALCHELPEAHAHRAAAFELVPQLPDLPAITLAADGTMASRQWICAIQSAIDAGNAAARAEATSAPPADGESAGAGGAEGASPAALTTPATNGAIARTPGSAGGASAASPLTPLATKFGEMVEYSSAKIDELDRHFSSTLAEQSSRTETQLQQLNDERQIYAEHVCHAMDEFASEMQTQMSDELLRIAEAELAYHTGMVSHMQMLVGSLKARQEAARASRAVTGDEVRTIRLAATSAEPPLVASLAPVEVSEPAVTPAVAPAVTPAASEALAAAQTPADVASAEDETVAAEDETEAVNEAEAANEPTTVPAPSAGGQPGTSSATQGELDEIID